MLWAALQTTTLKAPGNHHPPIRMRPIFGTKNSATCRATEGGIFGNRYGDPGIRDGTTPLQGLAR